MHARLNGTPGSALRAAFHKASYAAKSIDPTASLDRMREVILYRAGSRNAKPSGADDRSVVPATRANPALRKRGTTWPTCWMIRDVRSRYRMFA